MSGPNGRQELRGGAGDMGREALGMRRRQAALTSLSDREERRGRSVARVARPQGRHRPSGALTSMTDRAGPAPDPPCRGGSGSCNVLSAPRGPGGPPGQNPEWGTSGNRRSVGHPASDEAREGLVAARPLLENSTACRKSVPSSNPVPGPWFRLGFLWLIDIESVSS